MSRSLVACVSLILTGCTPPTTPYSVENVAFESIRNFKVGNARQVSVNTAGERANGVSYDPSPSADGQAIAFVSRATNLGPIGGTSPLGVYVRDLDRQTTTLVHGVPNSFTMQTQYDFPSIQLSADGNWLAIRQIVWSQNSPGIEDIFLYRWRSAKAHHVLHHARNGTSIDNDRDGPLSLAVSADGEYVVFEHAADDLVPDDTNRSVDVFVYRRAQDDIVRINLDSRGRQIHRPPATPSNLAAIAGAYPAISDDGRYVAFVSDAPDVAPDAPCGGIFVADRDSDGNGVFDETCAGCRATIAIDAVRVSAHECNRYFADTTGTLHISTDGRFVLSESAATIFDRDADENNIFDEACDGCTARLVIEKARTKPPEQPILISGMSGDARLIGLTRRRATPSPYYANEFVYDTDALVADRETGNLLGVDPDGLPSFDWIVQFSASPKYSVRDLMNRPSLPGYSSFLGYFPNPAGVDSRSPVLTANGRFIIFESEPPLRYDGTRPVFDDAASQIFIQSLSSARNVEK